MEFYLPFVPAFLSYKTAIIYASGIIEIVIGICLLIPKTKQLASWAYLILMCIFLPIHIADLFTETPAMGTHQAAIIRLVVQFLQISLGVYFVKYSQASTSDDYEN